MINIDTEQYLMDLIDSINDNLLVHRIWNNIEEVRRDKKIERANRLLLPFGKEMNICYEKCPCGDVDCGASWEIDVVDIEEPLLLENKPKIEL